MDAQHDKDEQMGNAATFGSTPKINRVFFKNWTMYVRSYMYQKVSLFSRGLDDDGKEIRSGMKPKV